MDAGGLVTRRARASAALFVMNIPNSAPNRLTLKHQETHGGIINTVATDALVLKHQAISIHNAD